MDKQAKAVIRIALEELISRYQSLIENSETGAYTGAFRMAKAITEDVLARFDD